MFVLSFIFFFFFFFFNDTATTEIYTLSLHDALPIWAARSRCIRAFRNSTTPTAPPTRSEEHTSELQSHVNLVCRLLLEKKKQRDILDPPRAAHQDTERDADDRGEKETREHFFFNDTPTTEIYTLSLHDALPISLLKPPSILTRKHRDPGRERCETCSFAMRSEEHTSELQSHVNLVCRLLLE